jgi:hypothetical protein
LFATGIFAISDMMYLDKFGYLPNLKVIWGLAAIVPLVIGLVATLGAGGAPLWKRFAGAALCGLAVGLLSPVLSGLWGAHEPIGIYAMAIAGIWRAFVFTIIAVLGVLFTEIKMPELDERTID